MPYFFVLTQKSNKKSQERKMLPRYYLAHPRFSFNPNTPYQSIVCSLNLFTLLQN